MARKDDAASERYMYARKVEKKHPRKSGTEREIEAWNANTEDMSAQNAKQPMRVTQMAGKKGNMSYDFIAPAKPAASRGSASMKMNKGMSMKGQGAFIDGKPAPDMHKGKKGKKFLDPALQAEYEAGMLDGVDMDKGMKSRRHGMMSAMDKGMAKPPRPKIGGSQYGPDTGIMNPMRGKTMGKGQGAFIDGAKAKVTKKLPPPPMPKPTRKPDTTMPVYPKPTPTRKPDTSMPVKLTPPVRGVSKGMGHKKQDELDKKLVMFNTRKGMMKGGTCPNCGSKMTKGMCKCGY